MSSYYVHNMCELPYYIPGPLEQGVKDHTLSLTI